MYYFYKDDSSTEPLNSTNLKGIFFGLSSDLYNLEEVMKLYLNRTYEWVKMQGTTIHCFSAQIDKIDSEIPIAMQLHIDELNEYYEKLLNEIWISFKEEFEKSILNELDSVNKSFIIPNERLIDERESLMRYKTQKVDELRKSKDDSPTYI